MVAGVKRNGSLKLAIMVDDNATVMKKENEEENQRERCCLGRKNGERREKLAWLGGAPSLVHVS